MGRNPFQWELVKNAEAQTNDNTVFKAALPTDGHLVELDLTVSITNGATSNAGYSNGGTAGERIEDQIDKIEIIGNGSKTILSVTAIEDLIAEAVKVTGKIPARVINEGASQVQTLFVPIYFGRFPDDKRVCIPNGNYKDGNFWDNLQLQITYSTAIAATKFATGTTTFTVAVKKLVDGSPPESKLVKIFKKKEDYTTLASGDYDFKCTVGKGIFTRALQMYCYEAGIEEAVDFTKLECKYKPKGSSQITYGQFPWSSQQRHNAQVYGVSELHFAGRALCSDTDVIQTYVPSPEWYFVTPQLYTVAAALATISVVESRAGDQLTLGSWHIGDTASAYTTDQANYWEVKAGVIPRYCYIDFDEDRTLADVMDTEDLTEMVVTATNGGAGGTVRFNEELVMKSIDFRGE